MKYRADIDGLRAIAIVLVLMYHAGFSLFSSGFVGVDVFFVISGFLITTLIHDSLTTNQFSFIDFYNRRLWRLQPVLVCLMAVTTCLTFIWFLPEDLMEFSRSARKTALFISNNYFNNTTTGYFSPDSHQLPLLHTWSLSIEWQCYLILPLLMHGLHKLFNKQKVVWVIYGLTILTLMLSLHYSKELPAQTYYQFSSRIVEFLIGSCVALNKGPIRPRRTYLLNLLAIVAVASIFYIASLEKIVLGYPNGYAFAVCLATGLLIVLGKNNPSLLVTRILSLKPIVFIGVLSYSLYIWHWAVFSILRYQSINETPTVLIIAFLIIGLIAYCSWRFIEKPTRQYKSLKFQYTLAILLLLPIALVHLSSYVIKLNSGYPQRFNQELVSIYQQLKHYESSDRPLCISRDGIDVENHCRIGSHEPKAKTAFMIGDSFANHYWGFMDTLGKDAKVSILVQGTSSCITLPGIALYDWWNFKNQIYQECAEQTKKYYHMISSNHYDYVILAQIWSNYFSDHVINQKGDERSIKWTQHRIEAALDKALKIIIQSGAKPVLIKSTAIPNFNAHDCFFKHVKLRQSFNSEQCQFRLEPTENEQWFNQLLTSLQTKYPQLVVIDPKEIQCKDNLCYSDWDGVPVYRDEGHITDYASYRLGLKFLQQEKNPFS
ncbi:acyltransferase family protein [Legionella waltersii]|uniref:O-acetyltransferase n=1 Tax=Legionella waltersii TaxID=66969 RepID=A0A0W1A4P2_9GAMM|nr:acyltransferase family protein [Legionella waltersii]KTD76278.1 O-acetyltransferase [Legionella waltersii]SNV13366.1 acyltransferase [Legionella waltersii]